MDAKNIHKKIRKKFGVRSISTANDLDALGYIPYGVSAQCLSLDIAMGRPGFPAGRLTEIVGLTHQGKSTLAYHIISECQRLKGIAILLETEQAFEAQRLRAIGVDTENLWLLQPLHIEEALEMIEMCMVEIRDTEKFEGPVVIVLDSIAGTPAAAEYEGGFDEKYMAIAARAWSLGLRKLVRSLAEKKIVLVFLNQLRESMERYGDKYVSYGGKAIGIAASIRVRVNTRQADLVKRKGQLVGAWVNAYLIKNKLATPFQQTKYYLDFSHGIDQIEDLWRSALMLKTLKPSGRDFKLTVPSQKKKGGETYIDGINRDNFVVSIKDVFQAPQKFRDLLSQIAIDKKIILPYGS